MKEIILGKIDGLEHKEIVSSLSREEITCREGWVNELEHMQLLERCAREGMHTPNSENEHMQLDPFILIDPDPDPTLRVQNYQTLQIRSQSKYKHY
jgi:hypothetical protein